MALAILQFVNSQPGGHRFRIDIGKNRYYSYAIGGPDTTRQTGIEILLEPTFTAPLVGPLPPSALGRGWLQAPAEHFGREARCIQLASFRTSSREGPAVSQIVTVPFPAGPLDDLPPPDLGFALSRGVTMSIASTYVETVPYSYQRSADYSSAMFLQAITSLLPQVLPAVGSLVGGLFKPGGSGSGGGTASGAGDLLAKLASPETIKLLTDLIKQVSTAKSVGGVVRYQSPEAYLAAAQSLSQYRQHFSEAKVAPALLAALPALMPVIEKVLNPETMKAIMENISPAKLTSTVTDAIGNFAKLGLESQKQLEEHLERLNPGVKNPELYGLLASLSTGAARVGSGMNYRRVDSVKLALAETSPQSLYGRSRLAYRYGQDLAFPFDVQTPRPIRHATLEISLKEAESLRLLYQKRTPLEQVEAGPADFVPQIPSSALSRAKAGEDYLLTLALCWKGRQGPKRGTAVTQLITLVGDYSFDRIDDSAPDMIPLSDLARDRDYWHKVWDQTFAQGGLSRYRISCDYCYVLEGSRAGHARMETKLRLARDGETRRHAGQLKAGMILSPDGLNKLLPRLSEQPLSPEQLAALRTPDFMDRFSQAGKTEVEFKGRKGDSVALWVYPEVKLQDVVLRKSAQVNAHGHVLEFAEETVRFPMPVLVHFVGTNSAS